MYEHITYDEILKRMLDRVSNNTDKRESSITYNSIAPAAVERKQIYIELDDILNEAFGDTASREFLIRIAAARGIKPFPATKAILQGEFTPVTISMTGKRFSLNALNYTVIEKINEGIYKVECETEGDEGNLYFGNLIPIDYINGLQTAELTTLLVPGEDEEETEHLRSRYFASLEEKPFGGNRKDYIDKSNSIPGVGATKVTRVWNGNISPAKMIPGEKVIEWYKNIIGKLDEDIASWLSDIFTAASERKLTTGGTVLLTVINSEYNIASQSLIDKVQETFDPVAGEGIGLAPIGHVVKVDTAIKTDVNITANLIFDEGYSWANIKELAVEILESYLFELRKTWVNQNSLIVRIAQIETRLLSITGVIDISGTKINGTEDNLILSEYEIPVLGGISV